LVPGLGEFFDFADAPRGLDAVPALTQPASAASTTLLHLESLPPTWPTETEARGGAGTPVALVTLAPPTSLTLIALDGGEADAESFGGSATGAGDFSVRGGGEAASGSDTGGSSTVSGTNGVSIGGAARADAAGMTTAPDAPTTTGPAPADSAAVAPITSAATSVGRQLQPLLAFGQDTNGTARSGMSSVVSAQLEAAGGLNAPPSLSSRGAHQPQRASSEDLLALGLNADRRTTNSTESPVNLVGTRSTSELWSEAQTAGKLTERTTALISAANRTRSPRVGWGNLANQPARAWQTNLANTETSPTAPPAAPVKGAAPAHAAQFRGPNAPAVPTVPDLLDDPAGSVAADTVTFTLQSEGTDANGTFNLHEQGTILLPAQFDVSDPTADLPLTVQYTYVLQRSGPNGTTQTSDTVHWTGLATEDGLLVGFDLDAHNESQFGIAKADSTTYSLQAFGRTSFVATNTTSPTETIDELTVTHNYDDEAQGKNGFHLSVLGSGTLSQLILLDSTSTGFGNYDAGSAADAVTTDDPAWLTSTFTDSAAGTSQGTSRIEGTLAADGTFTPTYFLYTNSIAYSFDNDSAGEGGSTEPDYDVSGAFSSAAEGTVSEWVSLSGTPDNWTAALTSTSESDYENDEEPEGTVSDTDPEENTESSDEGSTDSSSSGTVTSTLTFGGTGTADDFGFTTLGLHLSDDYDFTTTSTGKFRVNQPTESASDQYDTTTTGSGLAGLTVLLAGNELRSTFSNSLGYDLDDGSNYAAEWDDPTSRNKGHETGSASALGKGYAGLTVESTLPDWESADAEWRVDDLSLTVGGNFDLAFGSGGTNLATNDDGTTKTDYSDYGSAKHQFTVTLTGHNNGSLTGELDLELTRADTYTNFLVVGYDRTFDQWTKASSIDGLAATETGNEETIRNTDALYDVTVNVTADVDMEGTPFVRTSNVLLDGDDKVDAGTKRQAQATANTGVPASETAKGHDNLTVTSHTRLETTKAENAEPVTTFDRTGIQTMVDLGGKVIGTNNSNPASKVAREHEADVDGTVTGSSYQHGTIGAGGAASSANTSGVLSVNLIGSSTAKTVTVITVDDWAPHPYNPYFTTVNKYTGVFPRAPVPPTSNAPKSATVTVTKQIQVPNSKLVESSTGHDGVWTLDALDLNSRTMTLNAYEGNYTNCLILSGGSGIGSEIRVVTVDKIVNGSGTELTGKQITNEIWNLDAHANVVAGDYTGTAWVHLWWDKTGTETGKFGPLDAATPTRKTIENGATNYGYDLVAGPQKYIRSKQLQTHFLETTEELTTNGIELVLGNGKDTAQFNGAYEIPNASGGTNWLASSTTTTAEFCFLDGGLPSIMATHIQDTQWRNTDAAGNVISSSSGGGTGSGSESANWFASASNFAAGMADALTCGLTAKIRQAGGFDDVVDKESGWYAGGQITGEVLNVALMPVSACGRGVVMKGVIKGLSAAQGVGSTINAVEAAADGNPLMAGLHLIGAKAAFGKAGKSCFTAGTPVLMADGSTKLIEEIVAGDEVLTRDEHDANAPIVKRRVVQTFVRVSPMMELVVRGVRIGTTAEHPFWVIDKGWLPAAEIRVGDRLLQASGHCVRVEEVAVDVRVATVYNFEVEEHHTYFVGGEEWGCSVWAHNAEYGVHWTSGQNWESIVKEGILRPGNRTVQGKNMLWFVPADSLAQVKSALSARAAGTGARRPDVAFIVNISGLGNRYVGGGGIALLLPNGIPLSGNGGRGLNWFWSKGSGADINKIIDAIRSGRNPF
jgi:hypothetical protein